MSKLDRIIIQGYKSIKELDLDLTNLNVLIGSNGAGKSNFISFFKLLNNIIENNIEAFVLKSGGANSFFYFGTKNTPEIFADLFFVRNRYALKFSSSNDDKLLFLNESAMYKTDYGQWYKAFNAAVIKKQNYLKIHEQ